MSLETIKQEIPEMDQELGLEYCGGDEEFYMEMLGDYAGNGHLEKLKECFETRDWENYRIEVHALKSTSRMMGFSALGDQCEVLQNAADAKDEEAILEKHDNMMQDLSRYVEILRRELM